MGGATEGVVQAELTMQKHPADKRKQNSTPDYNDSPTAQNRGSSFEKKPHHRKRKDHSDPGVEDTRVDFNKWHKG